MKKFKFLIIILALILLTPRLHIKLNADTVNGFPFYQVTGEEFTLVSEYQTKYSNSQQNRKDNIKLTAKFLNGAFVDNGAEFSFNNTVGERSEKRGFKTAKIIVGGKFTDGVGGGVCQVSTTLYNALLYAGLKITEYHAHSLPISYAPTGLDAMVSYRWADLKFINDSGFPIIIKVTADNQKIKVKIYGKKLNEKITLKSYIVEEILPTEEIIIDDGEYGLTQGDQLILSEGKKGLKSETYLYRYDLGGNLKRIERLRKDEYLPQSKKIVVGGEVDETHWSTLKNNSVYFAFGYRSGSNLPTNKLFVTKIFMDWISV